MHVPNKYIFLNNNNAWTVIALWADRNRGIEAKVKCKHASLIVTI